MKANIHSASGYQEFQNARPRVSLRLNQVYSLCRVLAPVQDGRIHIEKINVPFLAAGGTGDDFRVGIERAIAQGWLWKR